MKLTPYEKCLKMGKEKVNEVLAPIRAKKCRKKAELEMAEIDEKIATCEADIHEECGKQDVDFTSIISKMDTLALAERKKKQFAKIIKEMFPK